MRDLKIAIIGTGNLGQAILNGLLDQDEIKAENITATKRHLDPIEHYKEQGVHVTSDNAQAIKDSDLIILALKPYTIKRVLSEFSEHLDASRHTIVSLATGISIAELEESIEEPVAIFRAMPNTASDVNSSITCVCFNRSNSKVSAAVVSVFSVIGECIFIDEELMDSATVLGACGIAYALRFIRGMIQGGIEIGFDAETATKIATNTVKGASELLIKRENHPEQEIDKVTTPKGCTIAGLNEMEHNGFSSALIKGILTSFEKIES